MLFSATGEENNQATGECGCPMAGTSCHVFPPEQTGIKELRYSDITYDCVNESYMENHTSPRRQLVIHIQMGQRSRNLSITWAIV